MRRREKKDINSHQSQTVRREREKKINRLQVKKKKKAIVCSRTSHLCLIYKRNQDMFEAIVCSRTSHLCLIYKQLIFSLYLSLFGDFKFIVLRTVYFKFVVLRISDFKFVVRIELFKFVALRTDDFNFVLRTRD